MRPIEGLTTRGVRTMKSPILAAALILAAGPAVAEEWKLSVTPYVWATDVGIDVAIHDRALIDETIPFDELLRDIESAALVRAEAMRGAHGIAIDLFDVSLADDSGRVALPGGSDSELLLEAEIGMTILDVTGVHDPDGDGRGIAFLYGTRILDQREKIDATIENGGAPVRRARHEGDDTFVDGLLGIRYSDRPAGRWSYEVAADVSTGGTQLTWSVAPSVGYAFGERRQYRVTAGYRHFDVDFETDPGVDLDMKMSGFLVGLRFDF
jgi:hypothetical protein